MKATHIIIMLLWAIVMPITAMAQREDSVRWEHERKLDEVVVTGLTGTIALKNSPTPVSVVTKKDLSQTSATNIIDAVAHQPGMAQITTGGGISKPVIRGLGYNRVVVVNDNVRQEGQQWGDEHGIEIDPQAVGSVEILKGPASLMYGSDAMAGVIIMHSNPMPTMGSLQGSVSSEYQTNNGLFAYSVNAAGNHDGFVWNSRWSQKMAHAYKNAYDGYVGGSQFREQAFTQLLGLNKQWGYSHLTLSYYHLMPSIVEGEDTETSNGKSYNIASPYQHIHHYKAVIDNTFILGDGNIKAIVAYQQNRRQEYEEADECGLDFRLHTVNYDFRYTSPVISQVWKFVTGIGGMYQRSINEGTEYLVPAYRLFDYGLFATASHDHGRWHLSGGLRFDRRHLTSFALMEDGEERFSRFSRSFNGLTGSLGVVMNATRHLNFRLNIARGFRAPNISELGSNGEHEGTDRYEIGNHNLKAEHSWQADLGIDFSMPWLFVQASAFANRISNYIFLERIASQPNNLKTSKPQASTTSKPQNLTTSEPNDLKTYRFSSGDARLLGGELLIDIHPIERLHFENTLSMVDAIQIGKHGGERYLPFTPAPRWTSNVRIDLIPSLDTSVSIGIENNMAQNHAHTAGGTETITPAYTLFNASFSTNIAAKGHTIATITLTANNITDCSYQSHLNRLKYIGDHGFYNMGRNFGIKISLPFA